MYCSSLLIYVKSDSTDKISDCIRFLNYTFPLIFRSFIVTCTFWRNDFAHHDSCMFFPSLYSFSSVLQKLSFRIGYRISCLLQFSSCSRFWFVFLYTALCLDVCYSGYPLPLLVLVLFCSLFPQNGWFPGMFELSVYFVGISETFSITLCVIVFQKLPFPAILHYALSK